MVSYAALVLLIFVPNLAFVCFLEKAVLRDYDVSWVTSLVCFDI